MLIEQTLFGTVDKVQEAIDLLRQHEPPEGYFVAFSGGKDSVVVYDLVKRSGVKHEPHYHVMTIEPPELLDFVKTNYPEIILDYPQLSMYQLIVKYKTPPLRGARYCCSELKAKHGKGRLIVTGIRAQESTRRAKRKIFEPSRNNQRYFLHPLFYWTASDIWQYIHENNLPYCRLYDEGYKRIGCVLCPFLSYQQALLELERQPAVCDYIRRACNAAFDLHKDKYHSETAKNWKNGDDLFNWYIQSRKHTHKIPDGISLFAEQKK